MADNKQKEKIYFYRTYEDYFNDDWYDWEYEEEEEEEEDDEDGE